MSAKPKSLADIKRRASTTLLAKVDENELAVRVIEAMGVCSRPANITAAELLASPNTPPDVAEGARAVARACLLYMAECFAKAEAPQ